jgi:class 3 adenylate cyclase
MSVTFLFTDIEGSTRLLKQLRERYADALADHQRILREVFADNDGREIDTQGDSFFVAFRRASDAVGAAVAGQRALAAHEWPNGTELRVRRRSCRRSTAWKPTSSRSGPATTSSIPGRAPLLDQLWVK